MSKLRIQTIQAGLILLECSLKDAACFDSNINLIGHWVTIGKKNKIVSFDFQGFFQKYVLFSSCTAS
jgi:hypothetical protein